MSRVLLRPQPAAAAFKSIFAAARPRAASLAPAGQFTFCTWRKYFDPHAGGAHTSARFGAPAKAVLLWGIEKQTERCSLSPQAEANGVQLVLTRCGGSKGGDEVPSLFIQQARHARQLLALQELQGGAAGHSRSAACGGKSEAVSRKRHDWRPRQGPEIVLPRRWIGGGWGSY